MQEDFNLSEKLQRMGQDLKNQCQNADVNIKTWNFAVGKVDDEFVVEVNVKLGIKAKHR